VTRLAARIRADLAAVADPTRAAGMQAYMKSTMPYYGVRMPDVRAISKRAFAEHPIASCDEWQAAVLELWRQAMFREERYVAMELAAQKRHAGYRTPVVLPLFEEMIVTGAWWDHVDEAAHLVGQMLRSHPKEMRPVMRAWSTDANPWKRRVSIICQL